MYTSIFKSKIFSAINLLKHLQPITLGLKIPNAWTIRQTEDN